MTQLFSDNLQKLIKKINCDTNIETIKSVLSKKRTIVIFSGVSSGGKTTAGDNVVELLGNDFCQVIHQDDYYKEITEIDKNPFTNCTEWDDVQAINWTKINEDVENWLKNTETSQRLLILDGTMLMADPFLLKLSDLQFMFHVDYSVAKVRRELRDTQGDPNWVEPEPENAFDLNIWPKYVEHRGKFWEYVEEFCLEKTAFLVDGTMSRELICDSVLQKIIE